MSCDFKITLSVYDSGELLFNHCIQVQVMLYLILSFDDIWWHWLNSWTFIVACFVSTLDLHTLSSLPIILALFCTSCLVHTLFEQVVLSHEVTARVYVSWGVGGAGP